MKREAEIIGIFLSNEDINPEVVGLEKQIFKNQDARLITTQILAGIRDETEIFERLRLKSDSIASNEQIIKLINQGARRGDYEYEKIKALYQKIDELSAEKEDITIFLSEVESRQVDWLWRNYFPLGRLSMLSGDPNDGKTFFGLDMSARVTRGTVWPDGSKVGEPGEVLYLSIVKARFGGFFEFRRKRRTQNF